MSLSYLSDAWLAAAADAVATSDAFAEVADIGIEHRVIHDGSGLVYHLEVRNGRATLGRGPLPTATLRFSLPASTARSIASGVMNPQDAFVRGHIRIGGDPERVIGAQPAFIALAGALAPLRDATDFDEPVATPPDPPHRSTIEPPSDGP